MEIDLLTSVCAVWWNVTDETVAIDAPINSDQDAPALQIAVPHPDVYTENERRDYLQWLWHSRKGAGGRRFNRIIVEFDGRRSA